MNTPVIYGLSCTCHPEDGIRYVGQTNNPDQRLKEHRRKSNRPTLVVSKWIAKHGKDNIEMTVLEEVDTWELLNDREKHWIKLLGTYAGDVRGGLNRTAGGRDSGYSPESAAAVREANRGEQSWTKLTWDAVADIRRTYRESGCTYSELAEKYGVRVSAISEVVKNRTWIDPDYTPPIKRNAPPTRRGEDAPGAKLNWDKVKFIRESWPEIPSKEISRLVGVSIGTVEAVLSNKAWYDPDYTRQKYAFPEWRKAEHSRILRGRKKPDTHGPNVSKAVRGENHGGAKLEGSQVRQIHLLAREGLSSKELSEMFGVKPNQITRILSGERWAYVYEEMNNV